jgi:hypothetical protein
LEQSLNIVCNKNRCPHSNKKKELLIETVYQGPKEFLGITEAENMIKSLLLHLLSQEDRSAHDLVPK